MTKLFKTFLVAIFSLSVVNYTYAESSFPLLERLVKQEKYKLAYEQAIKLRAKNEGDPRFDYLYGFSALQTGHINEAVFALDRVTVTTPRVIRPRLELARAYLKLNNKRAAIKEFNDVLNLSPPPTVLQKVLAYKSELENANKEALKSVTKRLGYFSIGYDDNINFGYADSDINLPIFGLVTLNPSAVKQKSAFAEAQFQIKHRKIRNKNSNTFLSLNLSHREYLKNEEFNFSDIDLRAGITFSEKNKQNQFVVRNRPLFLNESLNSNTFGVDFTTRESLGDGEAVGASLSLEKYDNKQVLLSDRTRAILGTTFDFNKGKLQYQINLSMGSEWADDNAGKMFSRDILGVGYKLAYDWNASNASFVNFDYRQYSHKSPYALFPDKREDNRYIIKAVHDWQFSDKAAIIFSAKHTNNNSNLELYDAKSNEIQVGIRYEWD